MEQPLRVGQLAHATGVAAKTIRYYEQVGVLPLAPRSAAGYRQYSRHDVHRLLFVRRARSLGLSLAQLRDLTAELEDERCVTMRPRLRRLVTEQLGAVQKQIAELHLLERQLMDVLHRLEKAAAPPDAKGCRCLDGRSGD
jgi:MerR family gold-responsive transcriptional activator of gol and ges genes